MVRCAKPGASSGRRPSASTAGRLGLAKTRTPIKTKPMARESRTSRNIVGLLDHILVDLVLAPLFNEPIIFEGLLESDVEADRRRDQQDRDGNVIGPAEGEDELLHGSGPPEGVGGF